MKLNITLVVDEEIWRDFRAECLRRGLTASKVLEAYMAARLARWEEAHAAPPESPPGREKKARRTLHSVGKERGPEREETEGEG